jgi:hypothetical protein
MKPHRLVALFLTTLFCACSAQRASIPSEAQACAPAARLPRSRDETTRLAQLTARAQGFEQCMQASGYALDEEALGRELLRYEQIRNADLYGVDPRMAIDIREQELKLSPVYWRRADAGQHP